MDGEVGGKDSWASRGIIYVPRKLLVLISKPSGLSADANSHISSADWRVETCSSGLRQMECEISAPACKYMVGRM